MTTSLVGQGADQQRTGDTDASEEPVAVIENLEVTFHRRGWAVPALRGVSFELHRGEILGLVGESGSGKSVLGLTVLGLLPNSPKPIVSGTARVCGVDMVKARDEERRGLLSSSLGAVFQDPMTSLNPTMRVGAQLTESCGSTEAAVDLLDAVGIPEARRRLRAFPHELSGGLRQRVMIAMAIGGDRRLVIADEPTTALDVTVQAQILELIRKLRDERGTTFLFVTHDLGVAAQVADRVAVLYGGRMAEIGPTAEVLADPLQPYTSALLRSRVTMGADRKRFLPTIVGEPPDPRHHPSGCPFAPRCEYRHPDCDVELPAMREVSPGRSAACVRIEQLSLGTSAQPKTDASLPPPRHEARRRTSELMVQLRDVHKDFTLPRREGGRRQILHALRGIDLEVTRGEAVALVGESGCGKSTLLRVVAGFLNPDRGSSMVSSRLRPQMVFQDARASLTPWLTVQELVCDRLRGEHLTKADRAQRISDALRLVGLPEEVATAKASQLSGGQCQRVGLARAIVLPPDVLLCDEPTSALDVSLAATVLNLLGRLRHEFDMTVLFVTHDLAAARIIADRVAVMYLGQVVEDGPAEDITSDPVHPYTRALLEAVPETGRSTASIARGEVASPINPPAGCTYHTRCAEATDRCSDTVPVLMALTERHSHACSMRQSALDARAS
ncbi:MAG: ABC transporter ATP-binding protein [Acidimicrobiaceae bacterium]|nr:ABC transporter ATP-binding protein [Acidimicrobiaceae bacterium]